ncbi:hypothetical protein F2Q70_00026121 [Brassica cretica]|uniref:Uncharacterized protein n=1 Tax=Brassica cretica TaxID=69181 RepID=A0A8S9LDT3_BRACR|nr:hypothetical protein F2Q70_00026121 [Brassica cretica]
MFYLANTAIMRAFYRLTILQPLNTAGKASLEAGSSLTTSWQGHWKWQLDPVMGRLLDCAG